MKLVPDTSVIVDGRVTRLLREKGHQGAEVVVHEAVVAELEAQASEGRETGYYGIEELKELAALNAKKAIRLQYVGKRPTLEEIKLARGGSIDSLIRDLALDQQATLVTSDWIQARVAEAKGIEVLYLKSERERRPPTRPRLLDYFDENVMSVHIKADTVARIKVGTPGKMEVRDVGGKPTSEADVKNLVREVMEAARVNPKGFIEMDEGGATVVQLEDVRIAIARPPFADGWEITAVRPVARVALDRYPYADNIKERLRQKHRGILIAGPPGAGKSTLAQAVADFLEEVGWIVKTMEKPRDLQVSDRVTQYTALSGDMAKTADLLLLVRPDYTIYDELRKTADFQVFADMRMAGVGMIGVMHATRAIDAVQRLIGRVELGMIPQVVDTVLFVEDGQIQKLYDLRFTVKVPAGMREQDLARPVIEIVDFPTKRAEYEIYTFGEEIVVMPVEGGGGKTVWTLAQRALEHELERLIDGPFEVVVDGDAHCTVFVPERDVARLIGKEGRRVRELEERIGLSVDVASLDEMPRRGGGRGKARGRPPELAVDRKGLILAVGGHASGKAVELVIGDEVVFNGTVGRDGTLRLAKGSEAARKVQEARTRGVEVRVQVL